MLLIEGTGVVHRAAALRSLPKHHFESAVRSGELVRVAPRSYVGRPAGPAWLQERIALTSAGAGVALSHVSALSVWGLDARPWGETSPSPIVHVTVPHGVRRRTIPGVVVHQRRGFRCAGPDAVVRQGLAVVRLERALVESWSVLAARDARAPVIAALRARRTSTELLRSTVAALPKLRGRRELAKLLDLVDAGCHSELEMWGYTEVFADSRLPRGVSQHPLRLPSGQSVYLDHAYLDARVAVELDGERHHGHRAAREADLRRDAALATLGWLTLRWSHARLVTEPGALVAELLSVLAAR